MNTIEPKAKKIIAQLTNGVVVHKFESPEIAIDYKVENLVEYLEKWNPQIKQLKENGFIYHKGDPRLTTNFLVKDANGNWQLNDRRVGVLVPMGEGKYNIVER